MMGKSCYEINIDYSQQTSNNSHTTISSSGRNWFNNSTSILGGRRSWMRKELI